MEKRFPTVNNEDLTPIFLDPYFSLTPIFLFTNPYFSHWVLGSVLVLCAKNAFIFLFHLRYQFCLVSEETRIRERDRLGD